MKKEIVGKKELTRRYLVWYYKSLKEELDKIDRYFTQDVVDQFVLKQLKNKHKDDTSYQKCFKELDEYCQLKLSRAHKKKFSSIQKKQVTPEYQFLQNRFKAVEDAIVEFLGKQELIRIKTAYEEEMTSRILTAREY